MSYTSLDWLPFTLGRVHWVAPTASYTWGGSTFSASDGNDGLSPERALLTLSQALTNVTASAGEIIVLLPGAHTVAATLTLSKAAITITGIPSRTTKQFEPVTSLTISATSALFTAALTGANNIEICWLKLIPSTSRSVFTASTNGTSISGLHIHHCVFDMASPTANTGTVGISMSATSSTSYGNMWVHDNMVLYAASATSQGNFITTRAVGALIEKNTVLQQAGIWTSALTTGGPAVQIIRDNEFYFTNAATAPVVVINGTGASVAGGVLIARNIFTANSNPVVDNYSATIANIGNNYKTDPGAAAGGTLVAAIT